MKIVPLALAAILLLSCGSPGSGERGTIRVGLSSKSPTMLALFVALRNGYFAGEGVTVAEPTILPSGAKLAAAVVGGSIDVGIGVTPDVFNLHATGKPVKIIGSVYPSYYVDIVAGPGIQTPADADLDTRTKALQGRKIGITGPGSGTEALVKYLFGKVGLDPATDAELVSLGSDPSSALNALRSGQVDALSHVLSIGQQAETDGVGRLYISPGRGDIPALDGAVHGVAYTLQPVIDNQRADVTAFLRALRRGMDHVRTEPDSAKRILADYLSGMSPAVIDSLLPIVSAHTPDSLAVDEEGYRAEAKMLSETGLVQGTAPPLDAVVATGLG